MFSIIAPSRLCSPAKRTRADEQGRQARPIALLGRAWNASRTSRAPVTAVHCSLPRSRLDGTARPQRFAQTPVGVGVSLYEADAPESNPESPLGRRYGYQDS